MTVLDRAATTPLVTEIEHLVADVPGWSPIDELYTLSMLAYSTSHLPGDIVELGSWFGRSAIVLGSAARDTHGAVHCIDLFPERGDWRRNADGSYSFAVEIDGRRHTGYEDQTVWPEPFESQVAPLYAECPSVLEKFTANVRSHGLEDIVRAHRGNSATFAASALDGFQCRLLFIDGDHGYDAVKNDIARLAPFVVRGGWIGFDDAFSSYEGVDRAITELVIDNPAYDLKRQMTRKCFIARVAPAPGRP
jgi:predicted O-methyltransferase YrrM